MSLPPVYSTLIFGETVTSGGTTDVGAPPTGYLWVVVDMTAYNPSNSSIVGLNGFELYDDNSAYLWAVRGLDCRAHTAYRWHGRQVVLETTPLTLFTYDDEWSLRIMGYQLSTP